MGNLFRPSKVKTTNEVNPYGGLPDWALEYYQRDVGRGEDLIAMADDFVASQRGMDDRVVNMDPEELAAIEAMLARTGENQDLLGRSLDEIGGERFMSPYTDDVVDTTLAGFDRQAGRQRAEREASAQAIGGLSNTRAGVADALYGTLSDMDRAQIEAQLRDQAHRFGVDAGFSSAGAMRDTATTSQTIENVGRQWQATGGETRRTLDQAEQDSERDLLNWYANVFNASRGLPSTGAQTSTGTTPGPSPAANILGAVSTGLGIWTSLSDERAKEDIVAALADDESALDRLAMVPAYTYRYREGLGHTRDRTTGLMAQDIERAGIEGAVIEGAGGLKRVDPYPVLATVVQAVRELDKRTRAA